MNYKKVIKSVALSGLVGLVLSGCSVTNSTVEFNKSYNAGDFAKAKSIADTNAIAKDSFWTLQRASVNMMCKDYENAIKDFDYYESCIKSDNENKEINAIGKSIVSTIGSERWTGYDSKTYEGILVNTYKAMSYMALNDKQNARIELNRALDRQRRAKIEYEDEIKKLQEEKAKAKAEEAKKMKEYKKKQPKGAYSINENRDQDIKNIIEKQYSNVFNFSSYPDFVNPFTTYLAGLYFYLDNDYKKSRDLFKETYGMTKSPMALADFKLAQNGMKGKGNAKFSWIIIEDGLSSVKKEKRLHLPLFMVTKKAYLVNVALPSLIDRDYAYKDYLATNSKNQTGRSYEVASMDNVIKSEFEKEFDMILFRAITSTTFKTILKFQLSREYGQGGAIVGELFSALTTRADDRTWSSMPKSFRVIRVPSYGEITLKSRSGKELLKFDSKGENSITFVRVPTQVSKNYSTTLHFSDNKIVASK
jgi:hypothetical protein